jgi:hypothetical protein
LLKPSTASTDLLGGGLLKLGQVNIAHAGANLIGQVDRGVGDLGAHQVEDQRLGLALAQHGGLHVRALGAFERLGHLVRGGQAAGNLTVHRDDLAVHRVDDVAGMDAGPEGGRALGGIDDINLVVLLLDGHAHAVIVAVLLLAHLGVGLGVVEVGVRVEHPQHSRNRPVVDGQVGLVAGDRLGVVLLHQRIDAC